MFIEWKHPSSKNRNGIIRGYQIQYVEVDDHDQQSGDLRMTDTTDGDKTEYVITNLEPDTRYQFTVAAYTRKGDGIRSRAKIVETKGAGNLDFFPPFFFLFFLVFFFINLIKSFFFTSTFSFL